MDYVALEHLITTVTEAVIAICAPVAVAYVRSHFQDRRVADAVQAGAGVAYTALVASTAGGGKFDFAAAQRAAIAEGTAAAERLLTSSVHPMAVAGALGGLLASDPTVSATGSNSATATSRAGGTAVAEASSPIPVSMAETPAKSL